MKTAAEILNKVFNKGFDAGSGGSNLEPFDMVSVDDALRQLCEAFEREVIGEDDYDPTNIVDPHRNTKENRLRTEQRARLRAFCGVGEQPSAVDEVK